MANHRPRGSGVAVGPGHHGHGKRLVRDESRGSWKVPAPVAQATAQQGERPLVQQTPERGVAALGDASQLLLSPRGVLARNQAQAGGELTSVAVRRPVAQRRRQIGGGEHSHPGDPLQADALLVRLVPRRDPCVQLADRYLQTLDHVEHPPLALEQRGRQPVALLKQTCGQPFEARRSQLRDHAELGARRAQVVDVHRALLHQVAARAMRGQHGRRLLALHRSEAHGGTLRRLADRLRVERVVLLALHVRLHEGRRDQPRVVPQITQPATPPVRPRARLHRHHAGRAQLLEVRQNLVASQLLRLQTIPLRVRTEHVERTLRQIQAYSFYNAPHGCLPLFD